MKKITADDLRPGVLPDVPLAMPTAESLLAEAASMSSFSEVTIHPADLVADAEEMLGGEEDLPDLLSRGYRVSEGVFERIRLLMGLVAPAQAELGRVDAASALKTRQAEDARVRLLEIRGQFAALGKAASLPSSLFSRETHRSNRLNVVMMRMEVVLENVGVVRDHLPDQQRVDALVIEARKLIDAQKEARREARLMRATRTLGTLERERIERLLFDTLLYVSAQGLAAYADDPTRHKRYSLDHCYGNRPSRVGDPGGGGPAPTPPVAEPA